MDKRDLLARTDAALQNARRAKAKLLRRIEAARCAGAKILLTLEALEGATPKSDPASNTQTSN